ncbi:hypothetical protein PPSIR1_17540 [Plesiocystis pacifica SIR-1]|uniref:Tetratricopeptide repeat protein n=1 Tax=Plesiocystis pacifica SIR-1 TaxID=391625 RepID=A6GIU9_9BACT|nr:hypothetical protein PPSIR1_17540 [Plesiocystis pacifica SIR-1]
MPPPARCTDPSVAPSQSEPVELALALLSLGEGERAHALARSLLDDGDEDDRPQARAVLALARAQANGPHASADARAVALDALMQAWRGLPSPEAASLRATVELELALRLRAAGPSSMWAGTQAFADDVGRQTLDPRASPRARAARAFLRAQLQLGEGEAASRALHAAVEASEGSPGTARWIYLEALARDRLDAGELERARSLRERALTEAEAALGPEHPALAPLVFALATTREASDPADPSALNPAVERQLERAAALWRQGPPSTRDTGALSTIEETLARAALAEGSLERARGHALALAQLQAQRFAPDAPEQLPNLFLLATVALREGEAEAARPLLDAAATILATLPAEDPRRVSASRELALATAELDALAESAD